MKSEGDVNKIFQPVPVNDEGKPVKGYSIYLEGELPKFLTKRQKLAKYKILRPNGKILAIVPTTFRKDIRDELSNLGYKFIPVAKSTVIPVKSIDGVRVKISNANWKNKYSVIINKGDVNEIIDNTSRVLKILIDNGVEIDRENICASYCGIPIKTEEDINVAMEYKR